MNFTRRSFLQGSALAALAGMADSLVMRGTRPMRAGVAGLGTRGAELLDALAAFPQLAVQRLCDLDVSLCAHFSERVAGMKGAPPAVTGDLDELLADTRVGVVFLALPRDTQGAVAREVLQSGRDVYLAPPCAASADEALGLLETVRNTGRMAWHGLTLRFDPALLGNRHCAGNGRLSALRALVPAMGEPGRAKLEMIDLALRCLGRETLPRRVSMTSVSPGPCSETNGWTADACTLEFSGGAVATLDWSAADCADPAVPAVTRNGNALSLRIQYDRANSMLKGIGAFLQAHAEASRSAALAEAQAAWRAMATCEMTCAPETDSLPAVLA